ncbi:O-antigen ligase family protein [Lihuaxuella thermophila]|uniref:O-antigen ligase n=1 Tax=Lihuaxuella thermophila TaxID=1173111 RepID=A0A1H8CF57_9BACL|nr:O-antigen ligase family protein [Lihuaxuella thermophila]SEM93539.1 O-antigen ligase [Lihuaxuella thermophila]
MRVKVKEIPSILEKIFIVAAIFFYTRSPLPLVWSTEEFWQAPVLNFIWSSIYGITVFLILFHWRKSIAKARKDIFILLLAGLGLISVFWSDYAAVTFSRGLTLLIITLFGIYLGSRYELKELLCLFAWALGIAAAISLIYGLLLPQTGIDSEFHVGAWKGIYGHKNHLGRMMALCAILFLLFGQTFTKYRRVSLIGFTLSVLLVLLSTSTTALVVILTLLVLQPLFKALRLHLLIIIPFFIFTLIIAGGALAWFVSNAETVFTTLGKDITLTGRTQLWETVFSMIQERSLLGYGYGAFWLGYDGPSAQVWLTVNWDPPHAHNGYLDTWLELGLLGLLLFVLGYIRNIKMAVQFLRSTPTSEGLWPLVFLTFMILVNISESCILSLNGSAYWLIYTATVHYVHNRIYQRGQSQDRRDTGSGVLKTGTCKSA